MCITFFKNLLTKGLSSLDIMNDNDLCPQKNLQDTMDRMK